MIYPAKGEKFSLAGIEVDGPYDPALPVGHIVNCHCKRVAYYDPDAAAQEMDPALKDQGSGMDGAKKPKKPPTEPPQKPVLKDMTLRQLEQEARDRKLSGAVDFSKTTPDVAAEIVDTLSALHTGDDFMFSTIGPMNSTQDVFVVSREFGGAVNLRYGQMVKDAKAVQKTTRLLRSRGLMKVDRLDDMVAHEYGHWIHTKARGNVVKRLDNMMKRKVPGYKEQLDAACGSYHDTNLFEQFAEVFRLHATGKLETMGVDWQPVTEYLEQLLAAR